jgi:hypothetical protein
MSHIVMCRVYCIGFALGDVWDTAAGLSPGRGAQTRIDRASASMPLPPGADPGLSFFLSDHVTANCYTIQTSARSTAAALVLPLTVSRQL